MLLLGALLAPDVTARGPHLPGAALVVQDGVHAQEGVLGQDVGNAQDADGADEPDESQDASIVAEVRARLEDETRRAAEGIAALRVAHASTVKAIDRLTGRLDVLAARAQELDLPALAQRAQALAGELTSRAGLFDALLEEVDEHAGQVASRSAALIAGLEADPAPRLSQLLDAEVEMVELADAVAPLASRSDELVQGVAMLNARVEDVNRSLAAADVAPAPAAPVQPVAPAFDPANAPVVELSTSLGPMVLALRPDVAPETVANFLKLVRAGFYDGLEFHRVVTGFVAQAGCPLGDGTGGPGWSLDAEFNRLHHHAGALSMARFAHPDSAGSQFFLCLDDWAGELDGKYTVFGQLLRGRDVLDAIGDLGSESGVPVQPVVIERAVARERRPDDLPDPPRDPDPSSGADR